jgi:hypothetical protein
MDPDGFDVKYIFDWGDGTTSETNFVPSGTSASASHSWVSPRSYYIRAHAIDSQGTISGWSGTKTVRIYANNPPATPSAPSGPSSGYIGAAHRFTALSTDPNRENVRYTFDWGDGSISETTFMKSGSKASAAHTWSAVGTYLVRARATDSRGASSAWSNSLVVSISNVLNYPPNRPTTPIGPRKGYVGNSYAYLAYSRDPNGDQIRYIFDWGDGTTSETGFLGSGKSASASKSWETQGTYYVKVRAEDSGKASSSWSNSLAVRVY